MRASLAIIPNKNYLKYEDLIVCNINKVDVSIITFIEYDQPVVFKFAFLNVKRQINFWNG